MSLAEIPAAVSNPYHPPRSGSDEPHAGVDLADRAPGSQVALAGRQVRSALAGQVAMVLNNRFPFGNAVIIETPLEELPPGSEMQAAIPTPAPTLTFIPALSCPASSRELSVDLSRRSVYLLYAHLRAPAQLSLGDSVSCGQPLGEVGASGNALNPHLHLEARIAPAGIQIESMAHYDNSATQEEMANYCLWSVSGLFQVADPLAILGLR